MPGPLINLPNDPNNRKGSEKDRGSGLYYKRSGGTYSKYTKEKDSVYNSAQKKGRYKVDHKKGNKGSSKDPYRHTHDFLSTDSGKARSKKQAEWLALKKKAAKTTVATKTKRKAPKASRKKDYSKSRKYTKQTAPKRAAAPKKRAAPKRAAAPKKPKSNGRFTRTGRTKYALSREYDFNEDRNAHTQNLSLLTENFGTPTERRKMRAIAKKRQGGYTMSDESQKEDMWALDTTNPYYEEHLRGAKKKYGRGKSQSFSEQNIDAMLRAT
tara:strand:- start:7236 stop:8039 length:804 start_codon:yes stop_codon:yes gene_type:complete